MALGGDVADGEELMAVSWPRFETGDEIIPSDESLDSGNQTRKV